MLHAYESIPEYAQRNSASGLVRLPPSDDIPITPRVRRLIDTPSFQRLKQVSQLGLVRVAYPGAGHTRFEHSLGTYRVAIQFLERLSGDDRFTEAVSPKQAELYLLAALLHDIGHWPFCHPMEDIAVPGVVHHEQLARQAILGGSVSRLLNEDWGIDPEQVVELIEGRAGTPGGRILVSMLSGPIDVDKLDYLARDSQHCGVPYGRNFDQSRLIASLCLNERADRIAVSDKGQTAAELMVFARYVMFSEVYWHHTVRSATAMLQRVVYELASQLDWAFLFTASEQQFADHLLLRAKGKAISTLIDNLFGIERQLYKRLAQYSFLESPELHSRLARQPYEKLVECSNRLSEIIATQLGLDVATHEVLIDAPPAKLEVQFNVDIYYSKLNRYRSLGEVSPVVQTLARRQFDDYVKRVRVFIAPRLAIALEDLDKEALIRIAIDDTFATTL